LTQGLLLRWNTTREVGMQQENITAIERLIFYSSRATFRM